ncbi:hypothetical protein TVAG_551660 [Trichomonas vaginalis G3]|uniref:DUF3447 domain-containing protein n=1 Tax=Trichomonas vaginalis (strain ATCC PRA-98 / G3) TaxID=412133 RepID=A2GDT2_TRIV3|nr:protein ubiquitination [Trichomonas vaginalis G3]EAX84684.1 hypothetical protein TVAG_551660 [Trichomonas vaginalis G3]KAI5499222.1 protein ubiquitination [Trichomonas vaginalis G3]|eukprot:XP_001297614.1 hypothetical protein [Trichomonas vaginalis G3]
MCLAVLSADQLNNCKKFEEFTELLWQTDYSIIPDIVDITKKLMDENIICNALIVNIIDMISYKNRKNLRFYHSLFKELVDKLIVTIPSHYYFSCQPLQAALIKTECYDGDTPEEYIDKNLDEIYQIYPKQTINYCLFWDDAQTLECLALLPKFKFNVRLSNGLNLLDTAAMFGSEKCFEYLLANNAKVTQKTLENAFFGNNCRILEICCESFNITQKCLDNAIKSHHNEYACEIIEKFGFDFSWDSTLFFFNLKMFFYKLNNINDINVYDSNHDTALIVAAKIGLAYIVELLLKNGANTEVYDHFKEYPIMHAVENNHLKSFGLILQNGADFEAKDHIGWTTILYSALHNRIDITNKLIEKKAINSIQDKYGKNALCIASYNCSVEVASALIDAGIDMDVGDKNNWNGLFIASANNSLEIVKIFIERGCNIERRDKWGNTPFMVACVKNSFDVIKYLKEKNADINATSNSGKTALMLAADNNCIEVVKLLLDFGAKKDIKDCNG